MSPLDDLRAAHEKGIVLGLSAVSDIIERQDIDKLLYNDKDVFNIFLLALAELQREDKVNEKMGYFQIAGMCHRTSNVASYTDATFQVSTDYQRPFGMRLKESRILTVMTIMTK